MIIWPEYEDETWPPDQPPYQLLVLPEPAYKNFLDFKIPVKFGVVYNDLVSVNNS